MKPNKNHLQKVFQMLTVGSFGMAVNNTINNAIQNKNLRDELAAERLNNANQTENLRNELAAERLNNAKLQDKL
jgi:hypothetical protein